MDRRLGRLLKKADAVALRADKLVSAALRSVRGEMALLAGELNLGGSADDRATAEDAIRRRLATLSRRLDRLLDAQNRLAAKSAVRDASDLSGLEIRYSASRAEAVCQIVTPAQGDSLAAVLTDRMAQSLVNALRSATVAALRDNALAGGPLRELGRDILDRWQAAAAEKPVFTDSSGRTWDTARYIQMNARTNSMRVYNDCLADALARSGSDLVRVSRGGNPTCDGCFPWEGAILSLSGKTDGFPTYEQARASGCFHPNCTHTLDYVDETADADEIALQRAHPVGKPDADGAFDFDTADERRYEIDVDRKMREDSSLSREAAETAVNRDNLAANIRAGLVRADAADLVAELSDAQIAALCPDGTPPKFAPVKRVRGGTREKPKFEPERWRRGSRGGTVHIDRDTTAEHLAQVAKLDEGPVKESLGSVEWFMAKMNAIQETTTKEIADHILSKEFGLKGFDIERGYYRMRQATDEMTRLTTAKMAVVVLRDLKERFPNANIALDGLCFRESSKTAAACASLDHKYGKNAVMHIAWNAKYANYDWSAHKAYETTNGVKWTQGHYDIRMNFDTFRHEFGHILTTPEIEAAFLPVFKAVGGKKYFKAHVSAYGGTSPIEAIAESFATVTAHDYKPGTLDTRVENFVKYEILKANKRLLW